MQKNKNLLIIIALFIVGGGFWFVNANSQDGNNPQQVASSQVVTRVNTKTLKPGEKAPDFNITSVDGETLTLSSFKDKIVVVTSGAAWCPTCIIENKNFEPVYQEVKDKGVEFITVDIDANDTTEAVLDFQERYAPWHNIAFSGAGSMINDYSFWRFEITYIIDGDGIVRFADTGITSTKTLREELDKLI